MTDRYAVFGHPIAHSLSPRIHARFAHQTHQDLDYEAILAPLDGFLASLQAFRNTGGRGANVTIPFKEAAFRACTRCTPRADLAQAANTLVFDGEEIIGDNTDGAGLIADLQQNLGFCIAGKRILLLGAGGAARGVTGPLLACAPQQIVIANRTAERARELAAHFTSLGPVEGCGLDQIGGAFDLVINATAASLAGESLALSGNVFAAGALAYDTMYGKNPSPFLALAQRHSAQIADGLGMLVEQAAEAFFLWRAVRPDTRSVIAALRPA